MPHFRSIRTKNTYFISFLIVVLLSSCQASFGEKYTRGNLEIYFTEDMKSFVEPTADYFESHDLIHDEPHSIQLTSSKMGSENPGTIMRMVLTDAARKLPEEEKENIKLLEEDLRNEVFHDPNFRISLCNESFVEVNP